MHLDETLDSARTPAGQSCTATLGADLVGGDRATVVGFDADEAIKTCERSP